MYNRYKARLFKKQRCVTAVKWFAKQPKYLHEVPVTNTKADFSRK